MKTVLSIAGSDPSGGAGIQADLKTMSAHGVYGMTVITALTVQNTMGVSEVFEIEPLLVEKQLACLLSDMPPDAIKIGMIPSAQAMSRIVNLLKPYLKEKTIPLVIDPVMFATSGKQLMSPEAIGVMTKDLLPLATLITPNLSEASYLAGFEIYDELGMRVAARQLVERHHCHVLLKGGHLKFEANDLLEMPHCHRWYKTERIDNPNTHGTGCTLSTAIASNLALGEPLEMAVDQAKTYLSKAIGAQLNLGKGIGPLKHNVMP